MRVVIEKSRAHGEIYAPKSKSMAHRLLIAAGLAHGTSKIKGISECDDVLATADCLRALGATLVRDGDNITVSGIDIREAVPSGTLHCRESGSTMRFFIPLALTCGKKVRFHGEGRLPYRPMDIYEDICRERGFMLSHDGEYIDVCGELCGGDYTVRGDVSSQFISGLLFAAPVLDGDTRIHITGKIESRSYIDMTMYAMSLFGVVAVWENESTIFVKGNQKYTAASVTVEGDFSGAVFIDSLNLFGSDVKMRGLSDESLQGDRVYRDILPRLCCGSPEIDLADCPDLAPILFALAAAKGGATFTSTARLRIKESDRAAVMAEELEKFGARLTVEENRVIVHKCELHAPTETLLSHGDHRIVMALATLATVFGGEIEGAEAVSKSYPDYFNDITSLGIKVHIYEN